MSKLLLLNRWIRRWNERKEMYPVCMRPEVFRAAVMEYSDYDNGIIRIKIIRWTKVNSICRQNGENAVGQSCVVSSFQYHFLAQMKVLCAKLGRDVAMILCLAGINYYSLRWRKKISGRTYLLQRRAKDTQVRRDGLILKCVLSYSSAVIWEI